MSHEPMRVNVTSSDIISVWAELHEAVKLARAAAQVAETRARQAEAAVESCMQALMRRTQDSELQLELELQGDDVGN